MSLDLCQYWMCEPRSLRALVEKTQGIGIDQIKALDAASDEHTEKHGAAHPVSLTVAGATALIPVQGVLLQRVPEWMDYYIQKGILNLTGLDTIRQQVNAAAADPAVKEIRLQIHSPGGTVAGTMEAAEAIAAARAVKPVVAEIETMAASGGYYLASQASRIESNADAEIGSIGVYAVVYDMSGLYEQAGVRTIVVSSGEHKGAFAEGTEVTEPQITAVKDVINDMASHFVQAVAAGRGMAAKDVRSLADGRMWLAPKAQKHGLIDAITNGNIVQNSERTKNMSTENNTPTAETLEKAKAEASAEATAASAARMKALREAFADDPAFAMDQFEKGASLEQAKAAYCDVLAEKNAALTEQNAKLEADKKKLADSKAQQADGTTPLPHNDADGGNGDGEDDFAGKVAQYMAAGLTRAKATAKAIRLHPDLHAAHLDSRTVSVV